MKRSYDNWKMRGDGEETGGVETRCPSRRHGRVIYWSHEECHECASRREEAARHRKNRSLARELREAIAKMNAGNPDTFNRLWHYVKIEYARGY